MQIRRVKIENFRGIKSLEIEFDDTTVLIGENNAGKTTVLDALRICLRDVGGRAGTSFEPFDFHLKDAGAEPATAEPIAITIRFAEKTADEWDSQVLGRLNRQRVVQVDANGLNFITLKVTCAYSLLESRFEQEWQFLNAQERPLPKNDKALEALQREVSYYYLSALRDAARHFDAKGPYWRPFLRDGQLPADKKQEIEQRLKEVNDLVVASHASFERAKEKLNTVQSVVPIAAGEAVSIEAVPGRIFDMLSKAQIHLGTQTGARVPVGRHGEGTQSLAVLLLFSAFLDTRQGGFPVVSLEEPEAHLHPSAIRALWKLVTEIPGQKIISTHSGDLLSEIPARALRRLSKSGGQIRCNRLLEGTLSPDEERKFDFHIRHARGELLFAKCWILVEGETETILLTEIARHLDIDLEQAGVRCVSHRNAGIEPFLKIARDFGVSWCVLADNDQQGAADQRHAMRLIGGGVLLDQLHVLPQPDIEGHLCASGFGAVYQAVYDGSVQLQQTGIPVPPGDAEYWPQLLKLIKKSLCKPTAALQIVDLIRQGAVPAPPLLVAVLQKAVTLAGA